MCEPCHSPGFLQRTVESTYLLRSGCPCKDMTFKPQIDEGVDAVPTHAKRALERREL